MDTQQRLQEWLRPFLSLLTSETRRSVCSLYVASLLDPTSKASFLLAQGSRTEKYDRLRHFVASGVWDHQPLCDELARQANAMAGGRDSILVIGNAFLSGASAHAVGATGAGVPAGNQKAIVRQVVALTLVGHEVAIPIGLRLLLPKEWLSDAARLDKAEVPDVFRRSVSHDEIALQQIDRLLGLGVDFGTVAIRGGNDHFWGLCRGLNNRGLAWVADTPEDFESPADDARSDVEANLLELRDTQGEKKTYLVGPRSEISPRLIDAVSQAVMKSAEALSELCKTLHLDDFDGRTWQSQHRHMLMSMIAFTYLRYAFDAGPASIVGI